MPLTIFHQVHHGAGNAPDTPALIFNLNPPALRFDLAIFDNPAMVAFSDDGIHFSSERELPAGVLTSLDIVVRMWSVRNKTVAAVARYDFTGYYDPVEIVGREFVPVP